MELFQRIEQLTGKKMPQFQTEEEEVMQLQERVAEAQRIAAQVLILFIKLKYMAMLGKMRVAPMAKRITLLLPMNSDLSAQKSLRA